MTDSFDTTRWSIIDKVRGDEPTVRREALTQLLTCYMPVLRAHLVRRKRLSPDLADELLQGFVVKNIVEGNLVERADPSAGKFYIVGEVKRSGAYDLVENLTVMKAITLAGGTTEYASLRSIHVKRTANGEETKVPAVMNTPIREDDIVVIPESLF